MVGRVQTGGEAVDGVAGAWQLGELLGERHDAIPELSDTFPGDPRVAKDRPEIVGEGDIDAARELVASTADAELFLYPGDQHYFADSKPAVVSSQRRSAAPAACARVSHGPLTEPRRLPVNLRRLTREEARRIAIRAQLLDADRPRDLATVVED